MFTQKENPTRGGAGVAGRRTTDSIPVFAGTTSPRHMRVLGALLKYRQLTRERLDHVAGSSNGPDVVLRLRLKGLQLPCELEYGVDRDGRPCVSGVYYMTERDRRAVLAWFREREAV